MVRSLSQDKDSQSPNASVSWRAPSFAHSYLLGSVAKGSKCRVRTQRVQNGLRRESRMVCVIAASRSDSGRKEQAWPSARRSAKKARLSHRHIFRAVDHPTR